MSMSLAHRLRRSMSDPSNPRSMSARARQQRADELARRFPDLASMRVLDLGGQPRFWQTAQVKPKAVTTVNIRDYTFDDTWITHVVGDACAPDALRGERFDLTLSNSLLEHVGGYGKRRMLADVVHATADAHWVQTPYRYFPIEPHWLAPGWQFLPVPLRAEVLRRWPLTHGSPPATWEDALNLVLSTELVSLSEMRLLFPSSLLWKERMGGLVKSIVAIKTSR